MLNMRRPQRTSFRSAVMACAVAGTTAVATLAAFPANAQQAVASANPCLKLDPRSDAAVRCEIKRMDRETKDAKAATAAADRRGAKADQITACGEFLLGLIKDGATTKETIWEQAGGKEKLKIGDTACTVARNFYRYGEKKAEALPAAALR